MSFDTMLIIISLLLLAGGVGKRTLDRSGVSRRAAVSFFIVLAALSHFKLSLSDGVRISPACITAAVWPLVFAFRKRAACRAPQLILPLAALCGITASALMPYVGGEGGALFASVLTSAAAGALAGLPFGLAFSGSFTLFLITAGGVAEALESGIMFLELTNGALACQLAGMLAVCSCALIKQTLRTSVRTYSDERTVK